VGKFAASIKRQKVKSVSASGDFVPTLLTRGSIPGLCWVLFIGPLATSTLLAAKKN